MQRCAMDRRHIDYHIGKEPRQQMKEEIKELTTTRFRLVSLDQRVILWIIPDQEFSQTVFHLSLGSALARLSLSAHLIIIIISAI